MSSQFSDGLIPSGQGQSTHVHIESDDDDLQSISSQHSSQLSTTDAPSAQIQAVGPSKHQRHARNATSPGSSSSSFDFTNERPNRWQHDRKLWYSLTSTERGIAASVDKAAATDLSRHLFNAFALKAIARQSEEKIWAPRPNWTAWPLSPRVVPRLHEETMVVNPESSHQPLTSREELEEVLIARITREARHRVFYKMQVDRYEREVLVGKTQSSLSDSDSDSAPEIGSPDGNMDAEDYDAEHIDAKPQPHDLDASSPNGEPLVSDLVAQDAQNEVDKNAAAAEASERQHPLAIPSTDTDADNILLQPSVRHIQSNFDKLLMALHRSRQNIRPAGRRRSKTTSSSPASRRSSRSRNRSESQSESRHVSPASPVRKRRRSSSAVGITDGEADEDAARPQRRRLRQRDWTDVLGMASVTQAFDPLVIERSRVRLSELLGEDMVRLP